MSLLEISSNSPRGAKRITSQISRRAGLEEKLMISAPADSFHSRLFGEKKSNIQMFGSKPVPGHI